METQPSFDEAHALTARSAAPQARLDLRSLEIIRRREAGEEEIELIDMRYQQHLALRRLEVLFAEGEFDC